MHERKRKPGPYRALAAIAQDVLGTLDPEPPLGRVAEEAARLLRADAAFIALASPAGDRLTIEAATDPIEAWLGREIPSAHGLAGWVCSRGEAVAVADIRADAYGDPSLGQTPYRRAASAPLTAHGITLGALTVLAGPRRRPFSPENVELLENLAAFAALALANARLFARQRRHLKQLEAVSSSVSDAAQLRDPGALLPAIAEMIMEQFGYDHVGICLRSPDGEDLVVEALCARAPLEIGPGYRQPITQGVMGVVARTGEPYLSNDTSTDPNYRPPGTSSPPPSGSEVCVPIRSKGEVIGVLNVEAHERFAFAEGDLEAMQALADVVAVSLENARLMQEVRQAERERIQSEKLATIGQLAAGLAHEINNPLAGIKAAAELLLADARNSDEIRSLQLVRAEAARASSIIRNLLDFARADEARPVAVDVRRALADVLELRRYEHAVHDVAVVLDMPELPPVLADPNRLQQVFLNLIVNAEQAMAAQQRPRTIRIVGQDLGDRVEIRFTDSGPGIPPGNLERIFDPFFTTRPVGAGTGLGLSTTYGILREIGGSIRAENAPGGGASFLVRLPAARRANGDRARGARGPGDEEDDDRARLPAPAPCEASVLLVDDEASIRQVASRYLRRIGFRVETAANGEEALQRLQTRRFDVIVTDLRMPVMDGEELFRRLSGLRIPLQHRFIFISGDIVTRESRAFLESTGQPCLSKPFDLTELGRHVRRIAEAARP